ncbi:histidine phosphatase family protein [Wenzhouxiangella limi]|uniref:Histidine phosphatase family protein n=1 Tax=Wenzhouxiangella limi TaxID=2707351 RepID=A0A845V9C8_9GAMM|nr:histidine phosphatase family protein [Wenzhouxiangella limi]
MAAAALSDGSAAKPGAGPRRPRLLLLRHAQGMLGTADYDRLSALGLDQADRLGQRVADELGEDWLAWSGALRRQRQTVNALCAPGTVFIDPCLNEYRVDRMVAHALNQSDALGLFRPPDQALMDPAGFLDAFLNWFPEVLERWQRAELKDPCNGSWQAFQQRVQQPAAGWRARLERGQSLAVVTSAGVISTLTASLCGYDLGWQRRLNVSLYNASVTELELDERGGWRLGRVNCVAHLEGKRLRTLA